MKKIFLLLSFLLVFVIVEAQIGRYSFYKTSVSSGVDYDADIDTYISGLSTPLSSGQLTLLNNFVVGLKSDLSITNLSDVFDVMYILAGETSESSLRNLVQRDHDATIVSSMAFTVLEGFAGDATADYLSTDYIPITDSVNFARNNSSFGIYIRTNVVEFGGVEIGTRSSAGIDNQIAARYDDYFYARMNNSVSSNQRSDNTDSRGVFIITRNGSAITDLVQYKNKTSPALTTTGSNITAAISDHEFFIGALNNNGTAESFTSKQISFVFIGKYITTTMRDYIVDRIETYMDANGKGIL
jgi:hypothetical protein